MKKLLAALAAMVVCAQWAMGAPAPVAAYGALPNLEKITLSPDGGAIAYVKGTEAKRVIVIQKLDGKQPPAVIDLQGAKLRGLEWGSSKNLIIIKSETKLPRGFDLGERHEWYTAQSYNMQTNTLHPLLDHIKGLTKSDAAMNIVAGWPVRRVVGGRAVVFIPGYYFPGRDTVGPAHTELGSNYGLIGLFRYDLESGETWLASQEGRREASDWLLDEAGNILAEVDFTTFTQRWKLVLYRNGKPDKTVMDVPSPIESPNMVGLSEDGAAIIVEMPQTVEGRVYKQVSLKDGSITPWRPDLAQAGDIIVEDHTSRVLGATNILDRTDYIFFDPALDAMWKGVKGAFASATDVGVTSWSDDRSKAVVEVFGPSFGNGYFFLDRTAKKAFPIASSYDGISEFYEQKWISYSAADGSKISAYLTLPKREAKNLPLVVLPHGGPHSRDYPGFDWLSQSLAARGYVVLQPQFRGSYGFGQAWLEAGFHEYGKKMQTDLSDGVRALAAQGLIDPKRVCIFGHSYGGYAALAGATLDTGIYRCAVSGAGPSDMRKMLAGWPKPTMGANSARFWDRFVGIEDGDMSKADAVSPAKFANRVTIPVMLIHGKDDTVVPIEQSEIMESALKSAGKPYEYVVLDHEDHWLSTGATRQKYLEAVVGFIEKHNPPQ